MAFSLPNNPSQEIYLNANTNTGGCISAAEYSSISSGPIILAGKGQLDTRFTLCIHKNDVSAGKSKLTVSLYFTTQNNTRLYLSFNDGKGDFVEVDYPRDEEKWKLYWTSVTLKPSKAHEDKTTQEGLILEASEKRFLSPKQDGTVGLSSSQVDSFWNIDVIQQLNTFEALASPRGRYLAYDDSGVHLEDLASGGPTYTNKAFLINTIIEDRNNQDQYPTDVHPPNAYGVICANRPIPHYNKVLTHASGTLGLTEQRGGKGEDWHLVPALLKDTYAIKAIGGETGQALSHANGQVSLELYPKEVNDISEVSNFLWKKSTVPVDNTIDL